MLRIPFFYEVDYFLFVVWIFSYLIGSVSFAILISKLRGLDDPRDHGSNNPGATNVMRTGDRTAALLTLIGDTLKGFIVVFVIKFFLVDGTASEDEIFMLAGSMLAVLLGHLFPIFFKFKGGKGVATSGGILFAVDGLLGISVLCIWLFVFCIFNISALAALLSAFAAVFLSIILIPLTWQNHSEILIMATWIISLMLFLSHHSNVRLIFKKIN